MHKNATKCNETVSKWCKNKHGASKIIDTFGTYQLPPSEEVEAVSYPCFSDWSSSDDDSERNLEDDKDAATKTSEDSPCLECLEEVERKAEEEEDGSRRRC
jgi:hypothetical protein